MSLITELRAAREKGDAAGVLAVLERMRGEASTTGRSTQEAQALATRVAALSGSPATEIRDTKDDFLRELDERARKTSMVLEGQAPAVRVTPTQVEEEDEGEVLPDRDTKDDIVEMVSLSDITIDPRFNVRCGSKVSQEEEQEKIALLAETIAAQGQLMPIVVWDRVWDGEESLTPKKRHLFLLAGFRRCAAFKYLAKKHRLSEEDLKVRAVIMPPATKLIDAEFANLTENVAREDLERWQIAERLHYFKCVRNIKIEELERRTGLRRVYIYELIKMKTRLCPELWAIFCGEQVGEHTTWKDLLKLAMIGDWDEQRAQWEYLQGRKKQLLSGQLKTGPKPRREHIIRVMGVAKLERLLGKVDDVRTVAGVKPREGERGIAGQVLTPRERHLIKKTLRYVAGLDAKSPFNMRE